MYIWNGVVPLARGRSYLVSDDVDPREYGSSLTDSGVTREKEPRKCSREQTLAMPSYNASDGVSGRADVTRVSAAARVHCIGCADAACAEAAANDDARRRSAEAEGDEAAPRKRLRAMQLPLLNRARDNIHASGHVSAGMFQMAWRAHHQTRSETANWSQSHDSHKIQPPTPYPHLDFLINNSDNWY